MYGFNTEETTHIVQDTQAILKAANAINLKIHNQYTSDDLSRVRTAITKELQKAVELWGSLHLSDKGKNSTSEDYYPDTQNNNACYKKIEALFNDISQTEKDSSLTDEKKKPLLQKFHRDLYMQYRDLAYSFETAKDETKNRIEEKQFAGHENTSMILLCKNVRIMEDVINKICANNIDKSIVGGEKQIESMKHGFQWLYCHEDINVIPQNQINERKQLDKRDSNRYLDYIKYQMLVASKHVKNSVRDSEAVDKLFDSIRDVFENNEPLISYESRQDDIAAFKSKTKELISQFFSVYGLLVNYRTLRFEEEEMRRGLSTPENKRGKSSSKSREQALINYEITNLSSIAVRVLLDRFVSFVKIGELNFGNSTFKCAWFNYSELSNSNYAGSDFKYARLENARMKNCDISTSNLTRADGGNTDFSGSNFTYSNLCGINLIDATLNDCDFRNAIFTDGSISGYKSALEHYFPKNSKDPDIVRKIQLYDYWKKTAAFETSIESKIVRLLEKVKELPCPSIRFTSDIRTCSANIKWEDKPNIDSICFDLTKHFLSKYISTELVDYLQDFFSDPNNPYHEHRLKTHGKVYLDAANLKRASSKNAKLNGLVLNRVSFDQGSFENSDISSSSMYYNAAASAGFISCNLNQLECFESNFRLSNFSSVIANGAIFSTCNFEYTNWNHAILVSATFFDLSRYVDRFFNKIDTDSKIVEKYEFRIEATCNDTRKKQKQNQDAVSHDMYWQDKCALNGSSFIKALADRVRFISIDADRCTFNQASMKESFWFDCQANLSDFIETDFRYSIISHCNFGQSNLTRANLTKCDIRYLDLSDSNLQDILFNLCDLNHVLFSNAHCSGMNLSGTVLKNVVFENCKLDRVNLSKATFENCKFINVDFVDLIGFRSASFGSDCSYEKITFREGRRKEAIDHCEGNLCEMISDYLIS